MFNSLNISSIDNSFLIENFFEETLQNDIIKYNFINNEKTLIDHNFTFNFHKNFHIFLDFIFEVLPEKHDIMYSSLLLYKQELKRDPGLFKSWRKSILIITIQNNVFIFDERINKMVIERFNLKDINIKECEDKSYPLRFVINEEKKGFIYNSNVKQFLECSSEENLKELKMKLRNQLIISELLIK